MRWSYSQVFRTRQMSEEVLVSVCWSKICLPFSKAQASLFGDYIGLEVVQMLDVQPVVSYPVHSSI